MTGWFTLLLTMAAGVADAQPYPTRPVRMIIPSGAGGITDILGRVVAAKLTDSLGQQVIIDNRPGASGMVGSQIVAKSTPDGYTLLMVFPSHPVNQSLFPADIPYDTVSAFAPITMVSAVAPVLVVNASSPAKSVAELIALGKATPRQLNHGGVGSGSMGSLAAELLRSLAGFRFQNVIYKGAPQALTALFSGEIDFYFIGSAGTAVPHIKAGKLRARGVGTKQRLPVLPDVPSISEAVPGYEARGWNGILAPARTPKPIVDKLNAQLVAIVKGPELQERLLGMGIDPIGSTPEELAAHMKRELTKWARVVQTSGARVD